MEHNEEERKEKQNPGFEALPSRISAIEQQLTQAASRLTSFPMSDRRGWSALARAARKSQALLRKVSELRLPGEWLSSRQRPYSDGRWIALAEALGASRSLWSDLKDYVRYAPRPLADLLRAHEPFTPQRIREVRDELRRERNWVVRKLRDPVQPMSPQWLPERPRLEEIYTTDARPRELWHVERISIEEPVIVPASFDSHPDGTPLDYLHARQYRVWFGTNRSYDALTDDLSLGACEVYIPTTHQFGSMGSSWISRIIRGMRRQRIEERVRLISSGLFRDPEEFQQNLAAELAKWHKRTAFVVVHGYNVEFEEAARRTAQMGYDLRIDGITAFFSWPSRGKLRWYFQDEEAVQLAERKFIEFMHRLAAVPEVEEINILAHSMGNRLLLGTIDRLLQAKDAGLLGAPIGQIILAAADVPAPGFRQEASAYLELAQKRVTSYSCTRDWALRASKFIHGGRDRIGLEPPIFVHPNVDSVSAGELDLHGFGHSYYAENAPVIYDLGEILHHNTPPHRRMRLERGPADAGLYWIIKP